MPPANFVVAERPGDPESRLWITVSTTLVPRARDYRPDAASGVIAVHEGGRTRLAAEGLGYTNECLLSPDGATLWVNETFARRLSAYPLADGRLGARRTHAEFCAGTFPDGLALTASGALYVTSIVSNRVIRVGLDGGQALILEEAEAGHLAWVETAFRAGEMGRAHLDGSPAKRLRNISNLAFGGPDLRTAYLGCLLGDAISHFEAPEAGHPLPHWEADLGALAALAEETR